MLLITRLKKTTKKIDNQTHTLIIVLELLITLRTFKHLKLKLDFFFEIPKFIEKEQLNGNRTHRIDSANCLQMF